jgi:hypothetical protein
MEIKYAQTAVIKAYDNDLINGRCIKAFRKTKRLLEKGANVRKTTVSIKQYLKLLEYASPHYKAVLTIAFNTGMDAHYIVVSDDSLTRAIDRYTKWFDSEVVSASVDQNVDQNVSNR